MAPRLGPKALAAIVNLHEFEAPARERMSGPNFDDLAGGSWDEITVLREELALPLLGCRSVGELRRELVVRAARR